MTTVVGYARVSTFEQILDLQQDSLTAAGCTRIFTDTASGARRDRSGLQQALEYVREGDALVVWCLDRLGRSRSSSATRPASGPRQDWLRHVPVAVWVAGRRYLMA